jgi:CubicO group peptidase (beta-lactamase class C family)
MAALSIIAALLPRASDADSPSRPDRAVDRTSLIDPGLSDDEDLPSGTIELTNLNRDALAGLVRDAEATHSDALLVMKDGRRIVERYFGRDRGTVDVASVTKSVVSISLGAMVTAGKLKIDAPLTTWFPSWRGTPKQSVTLRNVLTQTSTLVWKGSSQSPGAIRPRDFAAKASMTGAAGERFAYSNEATDLLSIIIGKAADRPLDRYVQEQLFFPLGIRDAQWSHGPQGEVSVSGGLQLSARDLARIALLMSERGKWRGNSVVSEDWIDQITRPASASINWYGLLWWLRASFVEDDSTIAALRVEDCEGDKLNRLAGHAFNRVEQFWMEAGHLLDDAGRARVLSCLQIPVRFLPLQQTQLGFYAQGWLGQYVAVYPTEHLIAIRLRRKTGMGDAEENRKFSFSSFLERVEATLPAKAFATLSTQSTTQ